MYHPPRSLLAVVVEGTRLMDNGGKARSPVAKQRKVAFDASTTLATNPARDASLLTQRAATFNATLSSQLTGHWLKMQKDLMQPSTYKLEILLLCVSSHINNNSYMYVETRTSIGANAHKTGHPLGPKVRTLRY